MLLNIREVKSSPTGMAVELFSKLKGSSHPPLISGRGGELGFRSLDGDHFWKSTSGHADISRGEGFAKYQFTTSTDPNMRKTYAPCHLKQMN